MFGEEPCESPRLASPWRNLSSSASSLSHSPLSLSSRSTSAPGTPNDRALERSPPHIRRSDSIETLLSNGLEEDFDGLSLGHGLIMQARKELPDGVRTIGPESDKTGHIEYKFVLKTPTTPHRLARLVTQLKWRLIEGGGCAVYELGVLDAGTLVGLSRVDMQETLDTLGLMLSHLGRGHVRISRVVLLGGAGGGSEISSTTPPHEADTTPSSSTLGFTSFDVGSTAIQPVYPGTSPITIKQPNPPNPEREPEERAALKRNKRDARRVKQRDYGGDIVATGHPRPNMESMESSTFNKARATRQYEAGAVRQPRNFRPSTGQVPGSTPEETYAPTRRPPNSTKQQAPTRPKVILTESIPSHRPRILSEDENEERFVVEAVVMKRPSSAMTPCKGESSDEGLEGMLARTPNDGSSLDAGPGSDEMFGSVDDEEGWSYLAFDSLPKVRRESSSVVV
ncbi:BQ5605_C005g03197 [Microbotryum silenes-dioicae]|uniref:BQ5605_C005g03197 protein n=1 Tax=Microbotryum silenes-dioicae TaxID=796604 RepID=A0A2X0PC90_9BASI|nr:BQ5605_C005g03197 [Microbotryum silenes-dioicae]